MTRIEVEFLRDPAGDLIAGQAARPERLVKPLVFLVEEEADLLEQGLGVRSEDRMLADRDEAVVQLHRVGHVEIPGQHQVSRRPRAAPEERVARTQAVAAGGAVAEMSEVDLRSEVEVLFDRVGELRMDRAVGDLLAILLKEFLEDPVERVRLDVALAEHERLARRDVELHTRHTRAILSAVVLLLHQQKQLEEAPKRRAVFLLIIGERFEQPHKRHAAFVSDEIAHVGLVRRSSDDRPPAPTLCPRIEFSMGVRWWFILSVEKGPSYRRDNREWSMAFSNPSASLTAEPGLMSIGLRLC